MATAATPTGANPALTQSQGAEALSALFEAREEVDAATEADESTEALLEEDDSSPELEASEVDEETEDQPSEEDAETEAPGFATLAELIEAGDADVATLQATVKIDGAEQTVTVKELIDSYQLSTLSRKQISEQAEERKALRAEHQAKLAEVAQVQEQIVVSANVVNAIVDQTRQKVEQQFNLDWNRLQQEDPVAFASTHIQYQQAQAQVQQLEQHLQQQLAGAYQQSKAAQEQLQTQVLTQNAERLAALKPEWTEAETAKEAGTAIASYLRTSFPDITDPEIADITDARALAVLDDARKYRELVAQKAELTKEVQEKRVKLAAAPAGRKITPRQSKALAGGREVNAAKQRLRKSGRREDAVKLLGDRLGL